MVLAVLSMFIILSLGTHSGINLTQVPSSPSRRVSETINIASASLLYFRQLMLRCYPLTPCCQATPVGLLHFILERLHHSEPRRVVAAPHLRVGSPPEVLFVISYYVWRVGELVPSSVGEPGFDPLEPPLFGQ